MKSIAQQVREEFATQQHRLTSLSAKRSHTNAPVEMRQTAKTKPSEEPQFVGSFKLPRYK